MVAPEKGASTPEFEAELGAEAVPPSTFDFNFGVVGRMAGDEVVPF